MIIRIELKTSEGEEMNMMFGNPYKNWYDQFREFAIIFKVIEIIDLSASSSKWIGWGGLKWCQESDFQNELNREGCQDNEPDNPKSRKYQYMKFIQNRIAENIANKIIKDLNKINERK